MMVGTTREFKMCGANIGIIEGPCVICKYETGYDGYDKIQDRK